MDKDEALKLALEALQWNWGGEPLPTLELQAINAIKEALAQPEQEPVAWQVKYRDDEGIPQIAWFHHPVHPKSPLAKRPYTEEPLYTTPPQRKPEQESDDLTIAYMTGFHAGKNKDAPQPKPEQEPVAWLESEPSTKNWPLHDLFANSWSNAYSSRWHVGSKKPDAPLGNRLTPLYLAPPQRTWFGLTEEERDHLEGLHLYAARNQVEAWIEGVPSFIDAIEAKLREKNGG